MSEDQDTPIEGPAGRAVTAFVTSTPGLVTVALAALYGTGVVRHIGELRAADLPVGAAFETVPLQQHLVAGIETIVSPLTLLYLLVIGLAYFQGQAAESPDAADHYGSTGHNRAKVVSRVMSMTMLLFVPWDTALIVIAMFGSIMGTLFLVRTTNAKPRHRLLLASAIGMSVGLVGQAYFEGHRPSEAVTRLRSGSAIHASYLGSTGELIYLGRNDKIVAVPISQVEELTVSSASPRSTPESVFELITGIHIGPRQRR
jgi:hypothetical protein